MSILSVKDRVYVILYEQSLVKSCTSNILYDLTLYQVITI